MNTYLNSISRMYGLLNVHPLAHPEHEGVLLLLGQVQGPLPHLLHFLHHQPAVALIAVHLCPEQLGPAAEVGINAAQVVSQKACFVVSILLPHGLLEILLHVGGAFVRSCAWQQVDVGDRRRIMLDGHRRGLLHRNFGAII